MKFITPASQPHSRYHVAEQALVAGLPEWRKMPYCRNGGLSLRGWIMVEVEPSAIDPGRVCGTCRMRMAAHSIDIGLGSALAAEEVSAEQAVLALVIECIHAARAAGLTDERLTAMFLDEIAPIKWEGWE